MTKPLVLGLIAVVALLPCSCPLATPGTQPSAPAQTPREATSVAEQSPIAAATSPTPTSAGPRPTVDPADLTWVATGISTASAGEGWVDYTVTLAFENSTPEFFVGDRLPGLELQTQEGYSYEGRWKSGSLAPSTAGDPTCEWPEDALLDMFIPFIPGALPPGFRICGAVGWRDETNGLCIAELGVTFRIGETLHPSGITRAVTDPTTEPLLVDLHTGAREPGYPLTDGDQGFDSLPATIQMGQMWVTVAEPRSGVAGSTVFRLRYDNRDSGASHSFENPIKAVIDSRGVVTTPELPYIMGSPSDSLACPSTVPDHYWDELGPLQQADYEGCVNWGPEGPVFPIYLVLAGYKGYLEGTRFAPSGEYHTVYQTSAY